MSKTKQKKQFKNKCDFCGVYVKKKKKSSTFRLCQKCNPIFQFETQRNPCILYRYKET